MWFVYFFRIFQILFLYVVTFFSSISKAKNMSKLMRPTSFHLHIFIVVKNKKNRTIKTNHQKQWYYHIKTEQSKFAIKYINKYTTGYKPSIGAFWLPNHRPKVSKNSPLMNGIWLYKITFVKTYRMLTCWTPL